MPGEVMVLEAARIVDKQHAQHRSLQDDVRHRGILILDNVYETTPVIRHQMTRALRQYEKLTESLFAGEPEGANDAAKSMIAAIRTVPTDNLRDEGHSSWHQHVQLYERVLKEFQHESALSAKRSYFAHLSEIVYCTVKSFGLGAKLSNVYFCPMALEGKGAFWLSESDQVHNPYFGSAMADCGELRESLGP